MAPFFAQGGLSQPAKAPTLEIKLTRKNHRGYQRVDILQIQDKKYFIDGKELGSDLPPAVQKSWIELEKGPKVPTKEKMCSAGLFVYRKKTSGGTLRINGCSEGAVYGRLIQNLEIIRDYAKKD